MCFFFYCLYAILKYDNIDEIKCFEKFPCGVFFSLLNKRKHDAINFSRNKGIASVHIHVGREFDVYFY